MLANPFTGLTHDRSRRTPTESSLPHHQGRCETSVTSPPSCARLPVKWCPHSCERVVPHFVHVVKGEQLVRYQDRGCQKGLFAVYTPPPGEPLDTFNFDAILPRNRVRMVPQRKPLPLHIPTGRSPSVSVK